MFDTAMRVLGWIILVGVVAAPSAFAQQGPDGASDASVQGVPAWWNLSDPDALLQRMQQASVGDPVVASRSISAALLHGVEARVAAFGLDALAALARPEGAAAVQRFLEHRRPTLRRHAIAAAVAIGGAALSHAVEARLGDPDPDVRGDAAMALGEMSARDALPTLWTALDRDLDASMHAEGSPLIRGCAHSIARLGGATEVERLITYLRRAPIRSLTEAFDIALHRADVPDATKLRVVNAMGALSTPDARAFLLAFVSGWRARPTAYVEAARVNAGRIQIPGE